MPIETARTALTELAKRRARKTGAQLKNRDISRLEPVLAKLRRAGAKVRVTAERVEVEAEDRHQSNGEAKIILTAAGADMPHFRKIGDVQITYVGKRTSRDDALIRLIAGNLSQ